MEHNRFKTSFAANIFRFKYAQGPNDTWDALAERLVEDVCGTRWGTAQKLMSDGDRAQLAEYIKQQQNTENMLREQILAEKIKHENQYVFDLSNQLLLI